jgi:hypothetical protein
VKIPGLPTEPTWTIERLIAVVVSVLEVGLAFLSPHDPADPYFLAMGCFIANLLIWSPEDYSTKTGSPVFILLPASRSIPTFLTHLCGWFMLILPIILVIVGALAMKAAT